MSRFSKQRCKASTRCSYKSGRAIFQMSVTSNPHCASNLFWFCFTLLCNWSCKLRILFLTAQIQNKLSLVSFIFLCFRQFTFFQLSFTLPFGNIFCLISCSCYCVVLAFIYDTQWKSPHDYHLVIWPKRKFCSLSLANSVEEYVWHQRSELSVAFWVASCLFIFCQKCLMGYCCFRCRRRWMRLNLHTVTE